MTETHPENRLIGYARVSTYGQTLGAQIAQLRAAGCSSRNIYREKVTGARANRRELLRMLDRLVRSTRDLLDTLAAISGKQAGFRSLGDTWADTTTPHDRLCLPCSGTDVP
jgi:DNA invertase Pin-like site-specific DNA recombinase